MKKALCSRLIYFILLVVIMVAGVHAGNESMDSCFACTDSPIASSTRMAGIQRIDREPLFPALLERKTAERSAEFLPVRQGIRLTAGLRVGQWLFALLFLAGVFQFRIFENTSDIRADVCRNRCRRRILKFIHQKDGKKA